MVFIHKKFSNFSIHSYTAPEKGYHVNSHIIETKNNLVIIDTQFLVKSAEEVFQFAKSLNKKIARVIVTHAHPDHWFGNSIFANCDIYRKRAVKAPCFSYGDETAQKKTIVHIGLGQRPLQETLLDLNF